MLIPALRVQIYFWKRGPTEMGLQNCLQQIKIKSYIILRHEKIVWLFFSLKVLQCELKHHRFAIVNNSLTLYNRNAKLLRKIFQIDQLLVIENFYRAFIIFTTCKAEISHKLTNKLIQAFRTYREENYTFIPYSDMSSKIFYPTNSYQHQYFFRHSTLWNHYVEPVSITCCKLRTSLCIISQK